MTGRPATIEAAWSFLLSLLLIDSGGPWRRSRASLRLYFAARTDSTDWKRTRTRHKRASFLSLSLSLCIFVFICLRPCLCSSSAARFYSAFLIVEARGPLDIHAYDRGQRAFPALANASKVPLCFAAFPVWKGYPISLVAPRCGSDRELIRSRRPRFRGAVSARHFAISRRTALPRFSIRTLQKRRNTATPGFAFFLSSRGLRLGPLLPVSRCTARFVSTRFQPHNGMLMFLCADVFFRTDCFGNSREFEENVLAMPR